MKERDIRLLTENGVAPSVTVEQTEEGFIVFVNGKPVQSERQEVRPFAKLDTVARFLASAGVTSFTVTLTDAGNF